MESDGERSRLDSERWRSTSETAPLNTESFPPHPSPLPSGEREQGVQPLDYFAAQEPARVVARGVVTWSIVLLLSWAPYLCGIVNASTVAQSYVPEITRAHFNATIVGLTIGLVLSVASLVWFLRAKHVAGTIAAGGVVLIQLCVAICLGATSY